MTEKQLPKGVDQSFRRTFNADDYKDKAASLAKKPAEEPAKPSLGLPRAPLQARDYEVKLDEQLGQKIIFKDAPSGQKGGYFCETCQCVISDSSICFAWIWVS